jgi:two-component system CheB/CheR fusion protein
MVEKKKSPKKKGKNEKGGKGEPKGTRTRKHPGQKQAEQEEEQTLQGIEPEATEAPEGETKKEPEAESPAHKTRDKGRFPIVGIGASAGGLEALESFFVPHLLAAGWPLW